MKDNTFEILIYLIDCISLVLSLTCGGWIVPLRFLPFRGEKTPREKTKRRKNALRKDEINAMRKDDKTK